MERYSKDNIILERNRIVLSINGRNIYNPPHDLLVKNGWTLYNDIYSISDSELTDIELAKSRMIDNINVYNQSDNIKCFILNGNSMWIDKQKRQELLIRYNAEKANHKKTTILWYNYNKYELSINNAILLINQIESYSAKCYDITMQCILDIKNMNNIDDIFNYNYMEKYPEILNLKY